MHAFRTIMKLRQRQAGSKTLGGKVQYVCSISGFSTFLPLYTYKSELFANSVKGKFHYIGVFTL